MARRDSASDPPHVTQDPAKSAPPPSDLLRALPQVDRVLRLPQVERLVSQLPRWAVVAAVRAEIARLRAGLREAGGAVASLDAAAVAAPGVDFARIEQDARARLRPVLRPVINATGVVLHTNLGRAPLPSAALQQIASMGGGYLNLEYRLHEGRRGSRQEHLQTLLHDLTGAEAHLVVNNNAAAVLLMLSGMCAGGEVIVSRGELVEIGGSFRVPDVMRASGARLREVGTTNRTHLRDYQAAIGPDTRALLKVHRSNFAVLGFVAEVDAAALSRCAHAAGLPCLYDLGAGVLRPDLLPQETIAVPGAQAEPSVRAALEAGCDVVTFSGDKLLGGPQAGVICGSAKAMDALRSHPLLRALRPDKLTLIALAATLELYRDDRQAEIPAVAMLTVQGDVLRARAQLLARLCSPAPGGAGVALEWDVLPVRSAVGGGAMPLVQPHGFAVSPRLSARHSQAVARRLRDGDPAVVARLVDGRLICDVRTLGDDELPILATALRQAVQDILGASAVALDTREANPPVAVVESVAGQPDDGVDDICDGDPS